MNGKKKISLLCMGLLALTSACEKTGDSAPGQTMWNENDPMQYINMEYAIDNNTFQAKNCTKSEVQTILSGLIRLARRGHTVSVVNQDFGQIAGAKEAVEKRFKSEEEAMAWAVEMLEKGYTVVIGFDEKDGVYIGRATRK